MELVSLVEQASILIELHQMTENFESTTPDSGLRIVSRNVAVSWTDPGGTKLAVPPVALCDIDYGTVHVRRGRRESHNGRTCGSFMLLRIIS